MRKKKQQASTRAKREASRPVRSLPAAEASSPGSDSALLIGGVALVVLVLGDTVFLALSSRFLRV